MKTLDMHKIRKQLTKALDSKRYEHTQGVAYTSAALAMRYGEEIQKAELAGLLHDCAKCLDNDKKIQICKKHNIEISEAEQNNPFCYMQKWVDIWQKQNIKLMMKRLLMQLFIIQQVVRVCLYWKRLYM